MQAVSGAGYPGVASLDILDNVVPYISGEDDKVAASRTPGTDGLLRGTLTLGCCRVSERCILQLETEPRKILGRRLENDARFELARIHVMAMCNRVPVIDGHTESVFVRLQRPATTAQVRAALERYRCEAQELGLPSAPREWYGQVIQPGVAVACATPHARRDHHNSLSYTVFTSFRLRRTGRSRDWIATAATGSPSAWAASALRSGPMALPPATISRRRRSSSRYSRTTPFWAPRAVPSSTPSLSGITAGSVRHNMPKRATCCTWLYIVRYTSAAVSAAWAARNRRISGWTL